MGLRRSHWVVLLLAGALCLLAFQGERVLTEHEVFAAQPGREMAAGRTWLLQPFAGEYRVKKPPGQSWLVAASLLVTGSHSEWAARLPSALAGIGLAVVTAMVTARLASSRAGLVAGLMTLTCVGVQQRARLAEADMALAFCVAAANAAVVLRVLRRGGVTDATARAVDRPAHVSPEASAARAAASDTIVHERVNRADDSENADDARDANDVHNANDARGIDGPHAVHAPRATPLPYRTPGPGRVARPPARAAAVVFWLAVAFGFLLKGPIVLGFTALPMLVAWAVLRFGVKAADAATLVRRAAFWPPAVALGLVLIAGWVAAALLEHPAAWDQWKHEVVDRVQGEVGHGEEQRKDFVLAYLALVPQSTGPWCLFAFAAAGLAWRQRREPAVVLLACWALAGGAMLSCVAFKVLHYALPLVPPVVVVSAIGFERLLTRFLRRRPAASRGAWRAAALAGWFGAAAAAWLAWAGVVQPKRDAGPAVTAFADAVEANVPAGQTVYLYRVGEERTAWYLSRPLRQTADLPPERPAFLICTRDDRAGLANAETLVEAGPFVKRQLDGDRRVLVRVD